MSATAIVATTGVPELGEMIQSVVDQSYETTCYVVVDGREHMDEAAKVLQPFKRHAKVEICFLPLNVGRDGFYGHRIYAGFTHLVNTDYVCYVDHDNWLDKHHVQSCVDLIRSNQLDWCYTLRKICDKSGNYLCNDDCESLGKWQTYHGVNLIDTSSFFLSRQVAIQIAGLWHNGWGADRIMTEAMMKHFPKFDCTGEYTVNYRLNGNPGSVNKEFFDNGNKVMSEKYNGEFPWRLLEKA